MRISDWSSDVCSSDLANRLVDGYSDKQFRPDQNLKRSELAQYLMMGTSVRQHLPFDHHPGFTDLDNSDPAYPFAESAVASGGALRDLAQRQMGVMGLHNAAFRPRGRVPRLPLAYSLVQRMAPPPQ